MDRDYKRAANLTVITAGLAVAAYLFFKYALGAVLPFLLAALIGACVSPLSARLAKKTGLPRRACSVAVLLLLLGGLAALIGFACSRLFRELGALLQQLEEDPALFTGALERVTGLLAGTGRRFGFLKELLESRAWQGLGIDPTSLFEGALGALLSSLTASLPTLAMGFVSRIPGVLLFFAVTVIAAFYFASDGQRMGGAMLSCLPSRWQEKLPRLREKTKRTLLGYAKAYLLLMLLTFCQVYLGLTILRVKYAFLPALLIAVVDLLPILGTGTVLVPWALFSFLSGDAGTGTGLLILYAVILILRQLLEPKIVGESLGLHPLAALASVYLGIVLLGIGGIFVGPVVALFLKELFFVGVDG